jgi:hypothetical protein
MEGVPKKKLDVRDYFVKMEERAVRSGGIPEL